MSARSKKILQLVADQLECEIQNKTRSEVYSEHISVESENSHDEENSEENISPKEATGQKIIHIEKMSQIENYDRQGSSGQNYDDRPGTSGVTLRRRGKSSFSYVDESEHEFSDPYDSDDSVKDKTYKVTSEEGPSTDTETDRDTYSDEPVSDPNIISNAASRSTTPIITWDNITVEENQGLDFRLFPRERCSLDENLGTAAIKNPLDIFRYFITNEILDLIVSQTNIYAAQQLNLGFSGKSRMRSWKETNRTEICKFLGVTLAMGLAPVPSLNLYWSKDPLFHNELISSTFTRDRFLLIMKFIHFANNETADKENRLYKFGAVLEILLNNYRAIYNPGKILVIDESMVPFRGRLHFRQYIKNKTHKYGVKLYKLCAVDGFTYNIKIYTGKGDTNADLGHTQSIVLKLLEPVEPKEGRIIFADNYYSGIELTVKLYNMKMLYCGTLRSNRKGLPSMASERLKKGEKVGKQHKNIRVIKWVDKRPVLMISSDPTHDATLIPTGKKNRKNEEVLKPKCVIDYNKAKKGVDFSDQMSSYHSVLRKSMKWYRKVMFELLLGTTVVNAWVVYNMVSQTKLGITQFRRQLADELMQYKEQEELEVQFQERACQTNKKRTHSFVKPEGPGRKKRKIYIGCYKKLRLTMSSREADKKVRRIISFCNDCPNMPGYCLQCFNESHQ